MRRTRIVTRCQIYINTDELLQEFHIEKVVTIETIKPFLSYAAVVIVGTR